MMAVPQQGPRYLLPDLNREAEEETKANMSMISQLQVMDINRVGA